MPEKNEVVSAVPDKSIDSKLVAILMGTKNGEAFLQEQLQSIADQTHTNWTLVASDDGSTDGTIAVLDNFAAGQKQKISVRDGARAGVTANFLSLATDATIGADYFAFSDQDDIWHKDKLRRALDWLATIPNDVPAVYCGRTELMSDDGKSYGTSPLFTRPPSFCNALVQSLGGGNTMVFNKAAKRLLESAGPLDVALHDWWTYQLVSSAGGAVRYDPQPLLKYRQHPDNLIGSNIGWRARFVRFRLMLAGRFRQWNATNIAALQQVPSGLITPDNRLVLDRFAKARQASLTNRLYYLRQSGVYRQTMLGNLGLIIAAILRRI